MMGSLKDVNYRIRTWWMNWLQNTQYLSLCSMDGDKDPGPDGSLLLFSNPVGLWSVVMLCVSSSFL